MLNTTPAFDTTRLAKDFTPTGIKIVGAYENDRNAIHKDMYKAMLKEVYGITECIIGHHMVYMREEKDDKGFTIQIVEEVPSADTLLFDHCVMRKLFGENYKNVMTKLAMEPAETRDAICALHFYNRGNV